MATESPSNVTDMCFALAKHDSSIPVPLPFPDTKGLMATEVRFYRYERLLSPTERPASFPRLGSGQKCKQAALCVLVQQAQPNWLH
jgi:hypothetical protein